MQVMDEVRPIILDHLKQLDSELHRYIPDIHQNMSWVRNPFVADIIGLVDAADGVQEELLDIQEDGS
jgi:hypothetical protein